MNWSGEIFIDTRSSAVHLIKTVTNCWSKLHLVYEAETKVGENFEIVMEEQRIINHVAITRWFKLRLLCKIN